MNRKTILRTGSMVLFLAWLLGCAGPYQPRAVPGRVTPMQFTEKIIFLDKDASRALMYVNNRHYRLKGGQLVVEANLQNRFSDVDLWAEVQVVFYDQANMRLEESSWERHHFPALEVTMIRFNSMRPDVVNYTVMIKNLGSKDGKRLKLPGVYPN